MAATGIGASHPAWGRLDEDGVAGILESWAVLPSQVADGARTACTSGAMRLMAAVLADAIQVYLKGRAHPQSLLFRDTERWIASHDRGWLLSYENVCDVLHIDAGRLRRALEAQAAAGARSLPADAGRLRVARGRKIRV